MENQNLIKWFEIPVSDLDRAMGFYADVFGFDMEFRDLGLLKMALFPGAADPNNTAGALVLHPSFYQPSDKGSLIYFNSPSGDLQNELDRVKNAGGEIVIPKRMISPERGYMGLFLDSEGNRLALLSDQ